MGFGGAFKKLGGALKKVAPSLASAAVGFAPGGGIATALARTALKETASKIGLDLDERTPEEEQAAAVAEALERATPEQLLDLKRADHEFSIKKKELEVAARKVDAADTADARDSRLSWRQPRTVFALGVYGLFGYIAHAMFQLVRHSGNGSASEAETALLSTLFGAIIANLDRVTGYLFGGGAGMKAGDR